MQRKPRPIWLFLFFCIANPASKSILADDFPQFRGSGAIVNAENFPTTWTAEKNVAWKVALPGSGWSQPVIVGDRVYVTSAVPEKEWKPKNFSDGTKTPESMGLGFLSRAPKFNFEWKVFCLNTMDGSLRWSLTVDSGKPQYAVHPSNTYATETPVADQRGVYVYFGATGKVAGISKEGTLMWEADQGAYRTSNSFGTGSSLALHDDKVFVQNFSEASADVVCLDSHTGETVWKTQRREKSTSWSSPFVWKNDQRVELIISSGTQLDGYNPANGDLLWTLTNVKSAATATPCGDANRLYFGGSDPFSKGPLFALRAGGSGDLSPSQKNSKFDQCDWLQKRSGPGMASPVTTGRFVYVVDKNILRCYEASSGERLYQKRVPDLSMVASSPMVVNDKMLILDENGNASWIAIGPEFRVVGTGRLPDTFWASPACANDSLYLRGVEALYCIRKPHASHPPLQP